MRYEKSQALLRLAFELQGSSEGLTLPEIMDKFAVSRRTAERMRDAVSSVFPDVEEAPDQGDRFKRWRIPSQRRGGGVPVSLDELTALHAAAQRLRREDRGDQADILDGVAAKLRSFLPPAALRRIEPDCEAMLEAEGLAMRPGPRVRIAAGVVRELREAIIGCEVVSMRYEARASGLPSLQTVYPYGFLYGRRHYLVAFNTSPKFEGFRLYSLSNIHKVKRLSEFFTRDRGFSLEAYAANSFGVFQEDPVDVVWRVAPEAADAAREHLFHPTQQFEELSDGSLLVRFRAGGLLEMAWHLFTWNGTIQVIEPPALLTLIREQIRNFRGALPPAHPR